MKIKLLSILLLISFNSICQTTISGYISDNSNWLLKDSPYIITGNTLVADGVSLTIEPGVIIKFENGTTFQVDGELKAIGSPDKKITFTSNNTSPNNGDWNHILFSDTSIDANYDSEGNYLDGSIFKYCNFSYGGGLDLGILNINKSRPHIEFSTFTNSGSDGIYINNANPKIDNCTISDNYGAGIISPNYLNNNDIEVINSTLNNNNGGGIQIESSGNGLLKFINNNISFNSKNAIFVYSAGGSGSGTIEIKENTIENNTSSNGAGLYIDGGFDIDITCNSISKNSGNKNSALYMRNGYNPYTINIKNNAFLENTTSSGHVVEFEYQISYTTTFSLNNNFFKSNVALNNSIINIWGSLSFDAYRINYNTFFDNSAVSTLSLNRFSGVISNNNFLDNETSYQINNLNETGELDINAQNNYWGTNDINNVDIYDWFDLGSLSIVELSPILNSSITTDTECSPLTLNLGKIAMNNNSLNIWPNPFKDELNIIGDYIENSNVLVEIYSIHGKLMRRENLSQQSGSIKISNTSMVPGVYLCKIVIDNDNIIYKKIMAK
ncbi:right-handed parallel beta-helix repeat-containing protein [Dokdonia sp. R86516]|uniref:right-handed parallel beta-helix repeat-containing protein n=1 Tax=Dokdonia sp. R86516 TaxID=3093856 RepID=UPI0037CA860A